MDYIKLLETNKADRDYIDNIVINSKSRLKYIIFFTAGLTAVYYFAVFYSINIIFALYMLITGTGLMLTIISAFIIDKRLNMYIDRKTSFYMYIHNMLKDREFSKEYLSLMYTKILDLDKFKTKYFAVKITLSVILLFITELIMPHKFNMILHSEFSQSDENLWLILSIISGLILGIYVKYSVTGIYNNYKIWGKINEHERALCSIVSYLLNTNNVINNQIEYYVMVYNNGVKNTLIIISALFGFGVTGNYLSKKEGDNYTLSQNEVEDRLINLMQKI